MTTITVNPTRDIETWELISHDGQYEYNGPLALFDRAAAGQAGQAATQAAQVGGTEFEESQADKGIVRPKLTQWLNAEHLYSPDQLNQLLTAAGAGAGGATAGLTGEAELEGARTRNTGSSSALLDSLARGKQKSMASASEGIAAKDVTGAVQRQGTAAEGLKQMGDADTSAALKAMGIQSQDIQDEIEASKTGWFQNLTSLMKAFGDDASGAGAMGVKV